MNHKAGLFLIALVFVSVSGFAQQFKANKRYYSIGGTLNAMNYVGELDPGQSFISPALKFTRPNLGIVGLYRYSPRVSFRGALTWGRIKGDDSKSSGDSGDDQFRRVRNLSFRNDIFELKADIIIDLFQNRGTFQKRPDYTPYVFAGLGFFYHNPKTLYNGSWTALQPLKTEGKSYSLAQISVPFGVGFRYKLTKVLDLAFEIGWRYTFTDYLDDVSTSYANYNDFERGSAGAALYDRSQEWFVNGVPRGDAPQHVINAYNAGTIHYEDGRPYVPGYNAYYGAEGDKRGDSNKDWYVVTGFQLTHIIYSGVRCPKFR